MQPYISFVVCSRNDDYAGGRAKSYWGVRYLAEQCDEFGLEAEVVLVEWNPPADQPRLAQAFPGLPPSRNLSVRILTVPPAIHLRYRHADKRPLHAAVAANAGLRRARGEFRVFKVADAYYPDSVIKALAQRRLHTDRLYRLERWDVAPSVGAWLGKPRAEFLEQCAAAVTTRNAHLPQPWTPFWLPDLFGNASGDFQLLAAAAWEKLRGYVETRDITSFEVDAMLSYAAYALGIVEERLMPGGIIYKISHGASHAHRLGVAKNWLSHGMLGVEALTRRLPLRREREFWLRVLLNYPAKTYSGIRKPAYERSLVRYKLLSVCPWLTSRRRSDWGLAGELLNETVLCRAGWEQT